MHTQADPHVMILTPVPLLVSVRVLHGRLEGDTRHRALLRPLLPGIHGEGGENKNYILL